MIVDLDADTLTLRRRPVVVEQFDGTPPPFAIVQASPVVSRRPRADDAIGVLLHIAMKTPEIFHPPVGCEYCSECAEWRLRSYFAINPAHKRGVDYVCKQCRNALDRQRRVIAAMEQGRELRRYYRPKAA